MTSLLDMNGFPMPQLHPRSSVAIATAVGLGSISALHVLWGRGLTFPFQRRQDLNDHVIGRQVSPSPAACNAVACLLAIAAVSVERAARGSSSVARISAAGCGVVLATRSGLGFSGRTHLVVPGSTSAAFRRNDRRIFAPVCAVLALGAACAATDGVVAVGRRVAIPRTPTSPKG
ncbi:MAG TPA: DUF3995 domain-containing protein [Ilumatobacter sp.]|nr:DUF3995 domain-containing protein [Ilumatobacter sp.]